MDIMIDLETLGVKGNAMILTVAAVSFNMETGKTIESFYEKIDIESYQDYKEFSFDGSTLIWWLTTAPNEARLEAFTGQDRKPLKVVMENLTKFIQKYPNPRVWSHGASFDISILTHALSVLKIDLSWKFWNIRDTRTLYDLGNVTLKFVSSSESPKFPEHHALGDCYKQIEAARLSLSNIDSRPLKKRKT